MRSGMPNGSHPAASSVFWFKDLSNEHPKRSEGVGTDWQAAGVPGETVTGPCRQVLVGSNAFAAGQIKRQVIPEGA
jgi:hypothetical protein